MLSNLQLAEAEALFFSNGKSGLSAGNLLSDLDTPHSFEDCWMFHSGEDISEVRFHQVKKVQNEADLAIFLDTLNSCFQKGDQQNPYGELGEYLATAKEAWLTQQDGLLEYFLVYKGEVPVAVSALKTFKKMGYILNVGSIKSVRGEGFGKLAALFCVAESVKKENTYHFLGTEEGNYPYEFYKRLGFVNRFRAN